MIMAQSDFFPSRPDLTPQIFAYSDPNFEGMLKVGYTVHDVQKQVAAQYPTKHPDGKLPYKIVYQDNSVREDGTVFTDKLVHCWLKKNGFVNPDGDWFKCTVSDVRAAMYALKSGTDNEEHRTETFGMRDEQKDAVLKTAAYFTNFKRETGKTPHFLWNCKMRFGKTFTAYQLAKKMGWKRILVLTFKPAVDSAWKDDLKTHVDFKGWQFISRTSELKYETADQSRPIVCFGSFQDYFGKNKVGGIKVKNEWIHVENWDVVIFDEYHYGTWRVNTKDLFYSEEKTEQQAQDGEALDYFDEDNMPITTNHYLYISETPLRAIASGEFIEEQIFNWTYSQEQDAKEKWAGDGENPYEMMPRMVLMTYQMPDELVRVAKEGEFDEFDLNEFFAADIPEGGDHDSAIFRHEDEVQKWIDLIQGAYQNSIKDDLTLHHDKPPMPFSHAPLLKVLNHTFWFMPSVASCYAMRNLLGQRNNVFFHDFMIVVAAGTEAGIGVGALPPVRKAMDNPLETRTITLSCGKLTTGVTVRPWSGIFILRNCSSPETYFQAAFCVQSPWVIKNPTDDDPNRNEIMKRECYVFDFAPNQALRQIADYSCRLNVDADQLEKKVADFIKFLPVLAYDGMHMKQIDAAGILDIALTGTSATLLARRWESALLVNVDNITLQRLLNNPEAMAALMNIEGFRNLNRDIETIINKSEAVKKAKAKANEKDLNIKEKRLLKEDEKEMKSLRKQIQDKLFKFATLGLFHKVTGLTVKDFELLVSLNVFNPAIMNDAVYKFKRNEDGSFEYIRSNNSMKDSQRVGGWDSTLPRDVFEEFYFVNEDR